MKVPLLIAFLLLILVGTSSAQEVQETVVNGKGFSLSLQKGWERESRREDFSNAYLRISSPDGIDEGAIYLQLFPKGRFTSESYERAVRRYVTEQMDGKILSESELEVGGRPAWRVEYEGNSVGFVGERRHFMNTVFFLEDRIAVVHCAAQSDKWDSMKESFLTTSDSLQVTDR